MINLNPNHPVMRAAESQWHAVLDCVLIKLGERHVHITPEDIAAVEPGTLAIALEELKDGLHVRLVPMAEAERMARREGGLPS